MPMTPYAFVVVVLRLAAVGLVLAGGLAAISALYLSFGAVRITVGTLMMVAPLVLPQWIAAIVAWALAKPIARFITADL